MTDRIIDARDRFSKAATPPRSKSDADHREQRFKKKMQESNALRELLNATPRLNEGDRKIIARNLGRSIEKRHAETKKQICTQLFSNLYGVEAGISKNKKRKRYIRFEGEPLNDHGPGEEFAANGPEYIRLIDELEKLLGWQSPIEETRSQLILFVCDGASFSSPTRPRVLEEQDWQKIFKRAMNKMLDKISNETDLIIYFNSIVKHKIKFIPDSRDQFSSAEMLNLYKEIVLPHRFEHISDDDGDFMNSSRYTKLELSGFEINEESPSRLYPEIRLARIYVPRPVLCLPASVSTALLKEIRTRALTEDEVSETLTRLDDEGFESWDNPRRQAEYYWRKRREFVMWCEALRDAGFDPDDMDWHSFADEADGSAQWGAEWNTYWEACTVDLHVIADGQPENLQIGLSVRGGWYNWWTNAPKNLAVPHYDDTADDEIEFNDIISMDSESIPWLQCGDRCYVCRASSIYYSDDNYEEFEATFPKLWQDLFSETILPLDSKEVWELLMLPMHNWPSHIISSGTVYKTEHKDPGLSTLRPLFDAPKGWTPAPDDTLASAILRGLSYGVGGERLDAKIISAVNQRVACLAALKDRLYREFSEGLAHNGYMDVESPSSE